MQTTQNTIHKTSNKYIGSLL